MSHDITSGIVEMMFGYIRISEMPFAFFTLGVGTARTSRTP